MADPAGESLYNLYQKGMSLIESGDFAQAAVPLSKAARMAPEKSSIREALGRAFFHSRRYSEAAREFEAVVERYPVNDFAHFCLGRALTLTGQPDRAPHRAHQFRRQGRSRRVVLAHYRPSSVIPSDDGRD